MTKSKTGDHPDLKMVNPNAAAIDIGSTMHTAAVNPDTDAMPRMCQVAKPMSATTDGCVSCIPMACCVAASAPKLRSLPCAVTCASANV